MLVDFYADWCGPCRSIAPAVEALAEQFAGEVDVRKVDVDRDAELAARYGIRSIPTLIVFKAGEAAETLVGAVSKDQLQQAIERQAA